MALRAGDVVRLFDGTTTPQKQKLFVCVYVGEGWFLRVNSKSHWRPNMPLSAAVDPCLAHDCFVELRGVIEYDDTEVDDALRIPANHLGRLSDATLTRLLEHVQKVPTLTPEEKATIAREIGATLPTG